MSPPSLLTCAFALLVPAFAFAQDEEPMQEEYKLEIQETAPRLHRWLLRGPYDVAKGSDPMAKAYFNESKEIPRAKRPWRDLVFPQSRVVPGYPTQEQGKSAIWYAGCTLHAESNTELAIGIWSQVDVRIWVNGDELEQVPTKAKGGDKDDWKPFLFEAKKGANPVLVKLATREKKREDGFVFALATPDGEAPFGIAVTTAKKKPDALDVLRIIGDTYEEDQLFEELPLTKKVDYDFSDPKQLEEILILGASRTYMPVWLDDPRHDKLWDGLAAPQGARGVLGTHPRNADRPARLVFKTTLPKKARLLEIRAASEAKKSKGKGDWILRVWIFDGEELHELLQADVGPESDSDDAAWRDFEAGLEEFAGKEVMIDIELAGGGARGAWHFEQAFLDRVRVR